VTRPFSVEPERVRGALLGVAVGDALGWPQEDRSNIVGGARARDVEPQAAFRAWRRAAGTQYARYEEPVREGEYSDDTQLMLAVARACLQGDAWLHWLRHAGRMADTAHGWLLVHAGVLPQWSAEQTLALADEVHAVLRSERFDAFVFQMYGNTPARWDDALHGPDRWRVIINALTRLRFCTDDGTMEFSVKGSTDAAPPGYRPWYDIAARRTVGQPIAFGHWSTLGLLERTDLLALDTGCVWGGPLTAARVDGGRREIFQVPGARP